MSLYAGAIFLHVSTGLIALVFGSSALISKKGSQVHRTTGSVFFGAMLIMSLLASYAAYHKPEAISVLNGILTAYLVTTGWSSIKYNFASQRVLDLTAFYVAVSITSIYGLYGFGILRAAAANDGVPTGAYFIFGCIGLIAAFSDARMLWGRTQLTKPSRVIRHLWRMCVALSIAMASFFTGQPQIFPVALQSGIILSTPALVVLAMMIYWIFCIRSRRSRTFTS